MKRIIKQGIAVLLAVLLLFEAGGYTGLSVAAEEIDKAVNPAEHIALSVPEACRDGGSWFFIEKHDWSVSESSSDKLYIPIQRTGNLEEEAEVTLKVIDLTSRHDVNYKVEIYKEDLEPSTYLGDFSVLDIALNAYAIVEEEPQDENDLAQTIHDAGGAVMVDGEGNAVANVTATPLDENGNPIQEPTEAPETEAPVTEATEAEATEATASEIPEAQTAPGAVEESDWTEPARELSPTEQLRAAREAATGTISDRQELEGNDNLANLLSGSGLDDSAMSEEEFNEAVAESVEEDYPGKEYRLHFNPGEEAKFLVLTPLYSEANDGDAQVILMLKEASEGYSLGEETNPTSITILDVDEPQPVVFSLDQETVVAKDGKAAITVNREGRINAIKGVYLQSWGGSAKEGDEYSGIGAKLWFPMGINSRTVNLSVLHGAEEKDFYVTITALEDETVETSTVHVIIPAGEENSQAEGELMDNPTVDGRPTSNALYIRNGWFYNTDGGHCYNDNECTFRTQDNKEDCPAAFSYPSYESGIAYDGIYVKYGCFIHNCKAKVYIRGYDRTSNVNEHGYNGNESYNGEVWLYWGQPDAKQTDLFTNNIDVGGCVGSSSYIQIWANAFHYIKRKFTVRVEDAKVLPLIGVSDEDVLRDYEAVALDDGADSSRTLWTGESFTVTIKNDKGNPLRLKGLEARKSGTDQWFPIANITGLSGSVTVELNETYLNKLNSNGLITFEQYGSDSHGGYSYKGNIVIRPVFEYINTSVEIQGGAYGNLAVETPNPTLLWDFNNDSKMSNLMGAFARYQINWSQGADSADNQYYTFTAEGSDPYVSVATQVTDPNSIQWVKIRYKNLSSNNRLQFFASTGGDWITDNTCINISLDGNDGLWHETVVNLFELNKQQRGISTSAWANNGILNWLRLDPLDGCSNGSQIQIDYIAFFPDEASAQVFRSAEKQPTVLWDFNSDNAMSELMGKVGNLSLRRLQFSGGGDEAGNEYYTFTATGNDPFVNVDTPTVSAASIQWVTIRYKNLSTVPTMEFYANGNVDGNNLSGSTSVAVPLETDGQWHTTTVNLLALCAQQHGGTDTWSQRNNLNWLRLDPLGGGCKAGDQILYDYIAFFPDETSARNFTNSGNGDKLTAPGTYTYHLGDRLTVTTLLNDAATYNHMLEDGFRYELRNTNRAGTLINENDVHYINGNVKMALSGVNIGGDIVNYPFYLLKPTFTEDENCLTVVMSDYVHDQLIDTGKGSFAPGQFIKVEHLNGDYRYTFGEHIAANVIYELNAVAKSADDVPIWQLADGTSYTGETLYLRSYNRATDNEIRLGAVSGATYVVITGKVNTATYNLYTGRSATDFMPCKDAYVCMGTNATLTDEEGNFTLHAEKSAANSRMRFSVTYNGVTQFYEVTVVKNDAYLTQSVAMNGQNVTAYKADAGLLTIENFTESSAHFLSVYANQYGQLTGTLHALSMNGMQLRVQLRVSTENYYTIGTETLQEHIKEVRVFFRSQITGETHGIFSSLETPSDSSPAQWSYDAEAGLFTLQINSFDPDHPESWTYGDVLMASITTDKKSGLSAWIEGMDMIYEPVSTGYGVYVDPDKKPRTLDYSIENMAQQLQVQPKTDEDGDPMSTDGELQDDDTRYSFGTFPYIGEINAVVKILSRVYSSATYSEELETMKADIADLCGETYTPNYQEHNGYGRSEFGNVAAFFKVDQTQYGGFRFMFGVLFTMGTGQGYQSQKNPFKHAATAFLYFSGSSGSEDDAENGMTSPRLYEENYQKTQLKVNKDWYSSFGGAHFTIGVYFGFYLDYGYIEIEKPDGTGFETSHEMVFMGAGGFIGFKGAVGYTWQQAVPLPWYFNLEAGLDVTFYIGSSGDPNKTLNSFYEEKEMKGQDFRFNFEFKGRVFVSGTIGVGVYKIIGARVSVGLAFESGYSNNMVEWYPNLFNSGWGYVSEITFTGTLDLIITSIDFYSATWPLPLADGFMYYFQEVRRGNKCITYVRKGVTSCRNEEMQEHGHLDEAKEAQRQHALNLCTELQQLIESNSANTDTIKDKTYALKNYAYDNGIITWVVKNTIEMNKQGGIVGAIINGALQDDSLTQGYHTAARVNSQWVANDGELMAAYSVVSSTALMEDAYSQPSSQIRALGNNRFLMVFLDDSPERDDVMAATLKWTVYDASNDTWTEPQTVQADQTADGKPCLIDGGDKLILAWASISDSKYEALKEQAAQAIGNSDPALVEEFLEKEPNRVLYCMDIFSAEFDKASESFGEIAQLTDDNFYDDNPMAIYDEETGDYMVLYYKTAQDDEDYEDTLTALTDLITPSPDPDKTYSVMAYMLYNNQTETPDAQGQTHEAGWARDYYFPLETAETPEQQAASLAYWGGQRFIPTSIHSAEGGISDPPIVDMTACAGYRGLGAYAYTVDRDFDLNTNEDQELYVQMYNFKTHGTYYPVCVAGTVEETDARYDAETDEFVTYTVTTPVQVGDPRLVRNNGSTFLFWRQDGKSLKYLNVTTMLQEKVPAVANPDVNNAADWTFAVQSDGTFATDAETGYVYKPDVLDVDFGSMFTDPEMEITDYQVITDEEDNLYVVWTDAVSVEETEPGSTQTYLSIGQEIFATAMIKHVAGTFEVEGEELENTCAAWSKPYRLTRDMAYNDGLALALDAEGNLMIVHNQYSKLTAESEEEAMQLLAQGKLGLTQDKEGNLYAASLSYNSPVTLTVTRCEKVGSLEVTNFEFTDDFPVAGETVGARVTLENVGLTAANGFDLSFYEYKDGVRGQQIGETLNSDQIIQVNSARQTGIYWTVPEDGPEGYSIQAVVREKNAEGYYEPSVTYSQTFTSKASLDFNVSEVAQEGDLFRVSYSVENQGNRDVPAGTMLGIRMVGLHGALNSERYGYIEDSELYTKDLTGLLPAKIAETNDEEAVIVNTVYSEDAYVDIPLSLLRYCGYDAIQLVLVDASGDLIQESEQYLVNLVEPMHLSLNEGRSLNLAVGETAQVETTFERTVFLEEPTLVYTVDDPSVACVDQEGNVTALSEGVATLTATLLPSGRSVSVHVVVGDGIPACQQDETCPVSGFTDLAPDKWYHDGVHWALSQGVMAGVGNDKFAPGNPVTRAMLVTMLYAMEGRPEVNAPLTFEDVGTDKWYTEAVRWAASQGIVSGYSAERFGPDDTATREQIVTMLYSYARYKGLDLSDGDATLEAYADAEKVSGWAAAPFRWAVNGGIISGTTADTLSPKKQATRAEVAVMLMRCFILAARQQ